MHRILIGTSGFSYRDWVGPFYPPGTPASGMLEEYARIFRTVEINSTYYAIPPVSTAESLVRRTGDDFLFTVKLPGALTHEKGDADHAAARFLESMAPLLESGRLPLFVAQFPGSCRNSPEERSRVLRICSLVRDHAGVVVEFRHDSWARSEVYDLLRREGYSWCSVDEPDLEGLMPRELVRTSDIVYLRFHSRDGGRWYARDGKERYHYRYTRKELEEWVPKIGRAKMEAGQIFLFFNNCHAGHAARNALEMTELLGEERPWTGMLF